MLLDKNLRLPGSGWWARIINGGVTWLTLALFFVSAVVVFTADFAADDAAKLIILSAPALLVSRAVASALYVYLIGGIAVIGAYGARRNLRAWREEGATLRLRLRRGFYWMVIIVFIVLIDYFSLMILVLLWLTWASDMLPWELLVGFYGLMPFMLVVLLLFMATYLPQKWLPHTRLARWRHRS